MPLVDPVTMSSPTSKGAAAQPPSASPTKENGPFASLLPVQIRQTPLAQAARHGLPALLAALFVVRFRALVADPVSTMLSSLPVVVAIQLVYAVVCLPAAGSQSAKTARKARPGEKKRSSDGVNLPVVCFIHITIPRSIKIHQKYFLQRGCLLAFAPRC
jgi:hypothetical protein